ncbi:hypothetical protein RUMHYD_02513 [Blautia hydrogenotrophica DSM 10507]|uniref:Uncharacterized protein n=2 Tax=Blautia hydrogenotrophica TaxID=53443 RepID=C0CNS0_BLAHS|nr:hypothetical protein RUMHYD_02513 [Blautia hydrogenotrophica DSM 10507]
MSTQANVRECEYLSGLRECDARSNPQLIAPGQRLGGRQACLPGRPDIGRGNRYEHVGECAGMRIPVRIAGVRCTEQSVAYTFWRYRRQAT